MKKGIIIVSVLLVLLVSFRLYRISENITSKEEREKLEKAYYEAVLGGKKSTKVGKVKSVPPHVIGRIMIPKQNIDYVILDKTTDHNLDISISKVIGPKVHEKGNLVLAGHNMRNGNFFGKLKNVKGTDKIIIEDVLGVKKVYKVRNKYKVHATDLSPLSQTNQKESIITLITCTDKSDERLIVVASASVSHP